MSNLKIFSDKIPVAGKRIIVRLDLNVPIKNSKIDDDTRINIIKPLIINLIKNKAKIIIISHLGRPKGQILADLSLQPIFEYFKKKISEKVFFYKGNIDDEAINQTKKLKPGQILLFENIRFYKEEENNDEKFAKKLSNLGEIYINEAFSCSHRKQASLDKITKFIDSYGGPNLEKEINSIDMILKNKKKPISCIIGGSKVSTKISILSKLCEIADNLIIVGAMANNFIKYKGFEIGSSLVENHSENKIKEIYDLSKKNNCKIIVPVDVKTSLELNGTPSNKKIKNIDLKDIILDIGEDTSKLINQLIDSSNTVFWNGPAGYYENKNFAEGSVLIAKKMANNTRSKSLISIVGGGDTLAAIKNTGLEKVFTHLSTAGGAFLESLEGKELPGIKVLKKN